MNRESKAYKTLALALETLFLALTGIYLVYRLSRSTTFHLVWPGGFEQHILWALGAVAVARLLVVGPFRKKSLAALVMAAIYVLVYRNDGYIFLLFLAAFTVGFVDIDYRRILKLYLLAAGIFYGVTLLAGMLGVITNYVTARVGRGIRSAWGMSYYTDFASLGLFLLMTLWVACGKLPDWAMLPLCAGYLFLAAVIAHSITSTICACLLLLAVIWHVLERRVIDRRRGLLWMKKGPELFATIGFPLVALLMFLMMLLYARGLNIGYRLNTLLSKRLYYSVKAWKTYGLKPFGTPFQQNGGGFSVFRSNKYNFVDSTYPLVLLRYGWVLFLAFCVSWGWTARRAITCRDRRLLLVMGVILVHAFSEHHFIDSQFNILVAMPLALYPLPAGGEDASESASASRSGASAWIATTLLFVVAAWLAGPALLSRLKTVFEFMRYGHGEHGLRLVCVLIVLLLGAALSAWAVYRILRALISRGGLVGCRKALAALVVCALSGIGLWLYSNRVIDVAVEQNRPMIEADREALEIAAQASAGKVVSGVLPSAYARAIDGVVPAAYFEDDLSRLHGATVLMPSDTERGPFIDSGFLYVPISDTHALYTGDRAVVEALAEAGYHPTGYYSGVQEIDLTEAAALNDLEYDPQAGLRLAGGAGDMANGPWQDLYGGKYRVTWCLSLPEGVDRTGDTLCTLSVTTYKGETTLLDKQVKLKRFDEQGKLTVTIPFKIQDTRNVAFEARVEPGLTVDIEQVSFVRTPTYDVHTFYDDRLRKTRQEYYALDGTRQLRKEGWFARDYSYDRYGNVEWLCYYDCDGNPTLIKQGYAQLRRVYNAKRKIVRQEYYGEDGGLIVASGGYAADEREYDRSGNVVVQRYYGADGERIENADGYAEIHRVFNSDRQVVQETYFAADGSAAVLPEGHSGIAQSYDKRGNVATKRYLDANGAPVTIENGYAEVRREYDGQHQVIRGAYFGVNGEPVLRKGGYAAYDKEYDDRGKVILQRYYGLDGEPIQIDKGYATVESVYDEAGKLTLRRYYDTNGDLIREEPGK